MRALLTCVASPLLFLLACNPYDPDLGDHPFRCGSTEPRCPDGYACNEDTDVCERGEPTPDAAVTDGTPLSCNDDSSIEPNDTTSQAFTTPIPDSKTCVEMISLAICPDSDKDLYRFRIDPGTPPRNNMKTVVETNVSAGQLTLRVLNGSGNAIGSGLPVDTAHIEVVINNLAAGDYYVEVSAPTGVENNYNLDIFTCEETGCATTTTCSN